MIPAIVFLFYFIHEIIKIHLENKNYIQELLSKLTLFIKRIGSFWLQYFHVKVDL